MLQAHRKWQLPLAVQALSGDHYKLKKGTNMSQRISNNAGGEKSRVPTVLLVGGVFLAGVSALSFESPRAPLDTVNASSGWPSGPADLQVAQKYGQIDHAFLLKTPNVPHPNSAGESIGAYESPPH